MKKTAIIVAGGSGKRAGGDLPKQLQMLDGQPVFMHSIRKFLAEDPQTRIILAVKTEYADIFRNYILEMQQEHEFSCRIVAGGSTRAESVMNALAEADTSAGSLIAVHDAARPLLPVEMITRGWQCARSCKAAVPAVPLTDSIRKTDAGGDSHSVPRSQYVAVQTPQVFDAALLADAYAHLADPTTVTDDASVVELHGHIVTLYKGEPANMKITGPHDLRIAELILRQ